MKATVSLPDTLFEAADALAKRLGMSRSALFAAALEAYLKRYRQTEVTEKLNEIYRDEESSLDPVMATIQSASLAHDTREARSFFSVALSLELEGPPDWSVRLGKPPSD